MRSFQGCWTCRLRRKKCDEKHPICGACEALQIGCHYDLEKPEWMDGGEKQAEMVQQLKRAVKEKPRMRQSTRAAHAGSYPASKSDEALPCAHIAPGHAPMDLSASVATGIASGSHDSSLTPPIQLVDWGPTLYAPPDTGDCPSTGSPQSGGSQANTWVCHNKEALSMWYLDYFFPFLFPLYRPSLLDGGRGWIFDMIINDPIMRPAALCLSSYFFSLVVARVDGPGHEPCKIAAWENLLEQTRTTFLILRQSLQAIDGPGVAANPSQAVHILASIIQVQRFEITVQSFENCQAHLNAALAIFRMLLDNFTTNGTATHRSSFDAIIEYLGSEPKIPPAKLSRIPSTDQAAFRFSASLLILDDIIASTALRERPRLYEYHHCLLNGPAPSISLEGVIGCDNWALLQIGEISALDAWKKQRNAAGDLDVMDLVRRAATIKCTLLSHLEGLENSPCISSSEETGWLMDALCPYGSGAPLPNLQRLLVTRVWAHAALIYLFTVVSGWQPASADVRHHVDVILDLLTHSLLSPALLRTVAWPFCVAGCLAEPAQEACLRSTVATLKPTSLFGTVRKAVEIMESVWQKRGMRDVAGWDLAACFTSQGHLMLLV